MKQLIFSSDGHWAGLVLRLTLGLIMLPHGLQKMFGWFGGPGFKAAFDYFTETMKLPAMIAVLIIAIEFLCPLAPIAGFSARICAFLFLVIMAGAVITTNFNNGFFMNWFGNQQGEGFEYHLLVMGICLALLITGSGKYAADSLIVY